MATQPTRKERLAEGLSRPSFEVPLVQEHQYVAIGPESRGNPFLEYLGQSILDIPKFEAACIDALPVASADEVPFESNPVLTALRMRKAVAGVYPTEYLVRLYQRVIELLAIACMDRNPLDTVAANRMVHMLQTSPVEAIAAIASQTSASESPSIFVMGASGMGKSYAAQFVLKLLPPPARHVRYQGVDMRHLQVPYLYVQCPPTGTLKSLLLAILLDLDGRIESARVSWRPVGLSQATMVACSARCR